jgi:two-component system, NarL family, sensor kinase
MLSRKNAIKIVAIALFTTLFTQKIKAQIAIIDSLSNVIQKPLDEKTLSASLIQLGRLQNAFGLGNPELNIKKGLVIAKKINDSVLLAKGFESLAIYNERVGNLEIAMQYSDTARRIVAITKDSVRNVTLQMITGELYRRKANYAQSLIHFNEAVATAEGLNDASAMSKAYNALAIFYVNIKDFKNGLHIHKKALAINKQLNNTYYIQNSLSNIGILYRELGQYKEALVNHKESLRILYSLNDSTEISYVLNEIGVDFRGLGKYDSAINYISSAIVIREQMKEYGEIAYSYSNLGHCYELMKDIEKSSAYYHKAIVISKQIKNNRQLSDNYLKLSNMFSAFNKNDSAFIYSKLYNTMRDSLLADDNQSIVQDLTIKYNIKEKDLKIREQSLALRVRNGILIAVLFLAGSIFYNLFNRQKRKKAEYQNNIKQLELDKLEQSMSKLLEGEEKERKRLGAELHDGVGQKLTVLKMTLDANNASEKDLQLLKEAMNDIRDMSHNLMPSAINYGLINAIKDLANKVNMSEKIVCEIDNFVPDDFEIPIEKTQTIYRIIQEIINNILKHAQANKIGIYLNNQDGVNEIEIIDNGIGIKPEDITNSSGIGWSNINTRCKLIGATFSAEKVEKGSLFRLVF